MKYHQELSSYQLLIHTEIATCTKKKAKHFVKYCLSDHEKAYLCYKLSTNMILKGLKEFFT